MLGYTNTLEQQIESEIARIESELAMLEPVPVLPVISLLDSNVISGAFNNTASKTVDDYNVALSRRERLLSGLQYNRRRLLGLRTHRVHAANFSAAA